MNIGMRGGNMIVGSGMEVFCVRVLVEVWKLIWGFMIKDVLVKGLS